MELFNQLFKLTENVVNIVVTPVTIATKIINVPLSGTASTLKEIEKSIVE